MSYLLTQMFLYMIVAFLLGLLLGWLLWRDAQSSDAACDCEALTRERDELRTQLEASRSDKAALQDRMNALVTANLAPAVVPAAVAAAPSATPAVQASKPEGLNAPRGGTSDPLQEINGVGPKLEKMLHTLGYYHFDQIAAWSRSDLAWVDDNLEGFKGRATRDEWVPQAKVLANR